MLPGMTKGGAPVDRRRQALGAYGERAAADYVHAQGPEIPDLNWPRR